MSPGRILGLDYGSRRVGVAVSDPGQTLAHPVTVIARSRLESELAPILAEYQPVGVVIGLPVGLGGGEGPAAEAARDFGTEVADICGCPIEFYDERFSTVIAERTLREGGVKGKRRRSVVDKVAAAVMLQSYLDGSA